MVASKPQPMEQMQPAKADPDPVQESMDTLLTECGGNMRAALRAAVDANMRLQAELTLTRAAVSSGYSRQWHHQRAKEV
ncbi:hypothetical protein [Chelativorans sp. J32]|uniref:hypothetical protein n=1 Tax=Chelativorans sp. J32 TaxID=935840 RepID=UPI0005527BFB|nr:hypothetical protein [Chelativorans sp. J32]